MADRAIKLVFTESDRKPQATQPHRPRGLGELEQTAPLSPQWPREWCPICVRPQKALLVIDQEVVDRNPP